MKIKDCVSFTEVKSFIPNTKHHTATLLLETHCCTENYPSHIDLDEAAKQKMLGRMSDIIYGDIKKELAKNYDLVGDLKYAGRHAQAEMLEYFFNRVMKLCEIEVYND